MGSRSDHPARRRECISDCVYTKACWRFSAAAATRDFSAGQGRGGRRTEAFQSLMIMPAGERPSYPL